ncbi:MAG: apolipoprotein N-acyltransferase [Bacteroidia bacterium]|nr:apolipoprotein N-acyltransferase [Bacteroidia bacterium]
MNVNTPNKALLYSVISALLLCAAWPVVGFAPLIFIAFVPLLIVHKYCVDNNKTFFWYAQLTMLLWNFIINYWVCYAEVTAGIFASIANALLMATVLNVFSWSYRKLRTEFALWLLPALWISFEHLHLHWDITWPWLTLGNVFSEYVPLIQWYEFTGHLGGSWWVWAVNILVYKLLSTTATSSPKKYTALTLTLLLPITYSLVRYYTYTETVNPVKIAIIQPNIDPYGEKFGSMGEDAQLAKTLALASTVLNDSTRYLFCPETTLITNANEASLDSSASYKTLRMYLKQYPNLNLVMGVSTYKFYDAAQTHTATARKNSEGYYFDVYNTAMQMNGTDSIQLYHKSKLVPGVEKMPFPILLKPLEKLAMNLGGTIGSLGVQDYAGVFTDMKTNIKIAPVICYESVYGDYVAEYVRAGAQMIGIVTNDGWWGNTPGYKQHLSYARLRAIETRRCVARSANTGISAIINQRGDIVQHTYWWEDDAFSATVNLNSSITLYVLLGEYPAYIALALLACFVVLIARKLFNK